MSSRVSYPTRTPHPRSCSRALERAQLVARDARDRLKAQGKAYGVPKVVHDAFAKTRDARDDALVGLDAEETRARAKDIASEAAELVALDEGVGAADRDVERCAMDFRDATERARRGGKADELRLPRLRAAISESEVARREALTMLNLAKSRRDRNERKRRERIEFSHEVRFRFERDRQTDRPQCGACIPRSAQGVSARLHNERRNQPPPRVRVSVLRVLRVRPARTRSASARRSSARPTRSRRWRARSRSSSSRASAGRRTSRGSRASGLASTARPRPSSSERTSARARPRTSSSARSTPSRPS